MQMIGQQKEAVLKKVSGNNPKRESDIARVIALWSTVKGNVRGAFYDIKIWATGCVAMAI
jgi:hypothetical protein